MTKEELDKKVLNRAPHSAFHHSDGFLFLATYLAYRKKKKRERMEKLRTISESDLYQNVESSKYEENLHIIK
jgi:hypothetical protein